MATRGLPDMFTLSPRACSPCLRNLLVLLVMATKQKTAVIVPLNGLNYATWRVQCQMALIRDGLWRIVNETEQAPGHDAPTDNHLKFVSW